MKKIKSKKNKKFGFTLIEMLIAVMVFSLSVTSLMAMSAKSLKTSKNAEDQVIADYLALEAIETVHNLRDNAILQGLNQATWQLVFQGGEEIFDNDGCFDGSGVCNFYPQGSQLILGNCNDCRVYKNNNNYYYYQIHEGNPNSQNGVPTKYKRTIKIKKGNSDGQIIVKVDVTWNGGKVTYLENLYLWE